jgi:hypothetical protein
MNIVVAALSPNGILGGSLALDAFSLVLAVVAVAGMWKVFEKAGQPGWGAIIPLYNLYLLCKITGRPGWWWALALVPLFGGLIWFILSMIISMDLAKAFGKSGGFGIGLWLLGFVFYPILGFGDAQYGGAGATPAAPSAAAFYAESSYAAPAYGQAGAATYATGAQWVAPSTPPPWSVQAAAAPPTPPMPQVAPPAPPAAPEA